LGRVMSILDAMKKNHPSGNHFYLSFIAVSPKCLGMGLGSRILKATFKQIDAAGLGAYAESSNPKNATFYERAGFVARKNIAPSGAPPLIAMWRHTPVTEVRYCCCALDRSAHRLSCACLPDVLPLGTGTACGSQPNKALSVRTI